MESNVADDRKPIKPKNGITLKIITAACVSFFIVASIIVLISFELFSDLYYDYSNQLSLSNNAQAAFVIDGDDVKYFRDTLIVDEKYERFVQKLDVLRKKLDAEYFYICADTGIPDKYIYIYDADYAERNPGNKYALGQTDDKSEYDGAEEVLITGKGFEQARYYKGEYGELYYAYSPIIDSNNEVVAFVGTDIDISPLRSVLNNYRNTVLITVLAALIIFGFIYYYSIRRILIQWLEKITHSATDLAKGKMVLELPNGIDERNDELGQLGRAFLSVSQSVSDLIRDTDHILSSTRVGKFMERADSSFYQGDYKSIINSLNKMQETMGQHFDAMAEAISFFDLKQNILYANKEMKNFLSSHGFSCDEENLIAKIISSNNSNSLDTEAEKLFLTDTERHYESTVSLTNANGGTRTYTAVLNRAWVVESGDDADGSNQRGAGANCVIMVLTDVTPMIRAKEEAEAASRAKSDFLSQMSHEIRTPMNAILGMSELLMSEELNLRQKNYIRDIRTSSESLLNIINDILDFSKIEAGKMQLFPAPYHFNTLLENLQSMFIFAARAKNIEFYLEEGPDLPECLIGDKTKVRQILINTIGNAVKFTINGYVKLAVHADEDSIYFDIIDTGIGMRKQDISRIFNDFDQLEPHVNIGATGTGLGLSITGSLIEMMGGSITVESEYGKGSVFHIKLPKIVGNINDISMTSGAVESFNAPDAKILVVDDNEVNLNVACGMLQLSKIEADTAQSGAEAIEKVKSNKYDIVFMDHMMPGMDGVETTRILRDIGYGKDDLTIIALTANAVEGVREMLLESGMNDYLSKPLQIMYLNQLLSKWLPSELVIKVHNKVVDDGKREENTAAKDVWARLESLKDLDIETGLKRIMNMKDVYLKTLGIMSRKLPESIDKITSYMEAGDKEAFTIEVHGIKGALANIAASRLVESAADLEFKSKDGHMDYCRQNLPAFIDDLKRFGCELKTALEDNPSSAGSEAGNMAELHKQLESAMMDLVDFEINEAASKLRKLSENNYGQKTNDLIQAAIDSIEEFDYEKAMDNIKTIKQQNSYDNSEEQ